MITILRALTIVPVLCVFLQANANEWTKTSNGAKTTIDSINIEVQYYTPYIVRVIKSPAGASKVLDGSISIIARPADSLNITVYNSSKKSIISAGATQVTADNNTGELSFKAADGRLLTRETGRPSMKTAPFPGAEGLTVSQTFSVSPQEHIFGLGSLADTLLSRRGTTKRLLPGNIDDGFPVINSSKGYGLVWDNYSPTLFTDNESGMTFTSEIGDGIDYYVIDGDGSMESVIGGMRHLSGAVPMFPLWTYGYWQSRERYKSQQEPVDVVRRYRQAGIPLDGIIQDWQYWGNNYLWNAMEFMNPSYSHPEAMLDSIHGMNARMIISIWSSFGPMTKPFAELKSKGLLFDIATWPESGIEGWPPRMDYPSGVKVYNAYSPEARDIYWKHLTRIHDIGMDGWWMDSTEPDHFDDKMDFPTGMGSYRRVKGAFPLLTVGGVADHQLRVDSTKRVFILTRSGWFGQQRTGCNVWTGDVGSTWEMLRTQIPQHLNLTLSGNPNTNSDIGGFFCGRYNMPDGTPAYKNPLFRELTTRWTQLAAFTPMMRSHGTDAYREVYYFGEPGEPVYDAITEAIKLRYRLLPYIYSTAWDVTANNGSFMRPLIMDFPDDRSIREANDRFMFGRSLLVAPILQAHYTPESKTTIDELSGWEKGESTDNVNGLVDFSTSYNFEVRLPKGTDWYNFFTGEKHKGGTTAVINADISTIPVFARAGSIIPLGPNVNYATEKTWDELTIKIFPGADGSFTLYEDENDNYNYTKSIYSTITLGYNARKHELTIGKRHGSFPGMSDHRTFHVINAATGEEATIEYDGNATSIKI